MRTSYIVFIGALLVAMASYVTTNGGIVTFADLLQVQNFFGLLGVIGGVIGAFFAKSPVTGNGVVAKVTGNGKDPVPPVVN